MEGASAVTIRNRPARRRQLMLLVVVFWGGGLVKASVEDGVSSIWPWWVLVGMSAVAVVALTVQRSGVTVSATRVVVRGPFLSKAVSRDQVLSVHFPGKGARGWVELSGRKWVRVPFGGFGGEDEELAEVLGVPLRRTATFDEGGSAPPSGFSAWLARVTGRP